jgi:hypothetical protein
MLSQSVVATTTLAPPLFTRNPGLQWAVKFDRHPGQTPLSPLVGASKNPEFCPFYPNNRAYYRRSNLTVTLARQCFLNLWSRPQLWGVKENPVLVG